MDKKQRPSSFSLRFLAEPMDVNFGGKVHGGTVMKWIDQAAYTCATAWSGIYCVTVYVGGIQFLRPIHIGHVVEVKANLIYTGRTSMHIQVEVFSGDPKSTTRHQTTSCIIIFVGIDDKGNTVPITKYIPETDYDKRLERYALKLIEKRREIRAIEV